MVLHPLGCAVLFCSSQAVLSVFGHQGQYRKVSLYSEEQVTLPAIRDYSSVTDSSSLLLPLLLSIYGPSLFTLLLFVRHGPSLQIWKTISHAMYECGTACIQSTSTLRMAWCSAYSLIQWSHIEVALSPLLWPAPSKSVGNMVVMHLLVYECGQEDVSLVCTKHTACVCMILSLCLSLFLFLFLSLSLSLSPFLNLCLSVWRCLCASPWFVLRLTHVLLKWCEMRFPHSSFAFTTSINVMSCSWKLRARTLQLSVFSIAIPLCPRNAGRLISWWRFAVRRMPLKRSGGCREKWRLQKLSNLSSSSPWHVSRYWTSHPRV